MIRASVLLFVGCLQLSAATVPAGQGSSPRPVVVELYTSQGCSSCPPADALLGELARIPSVTALAFHVDYWDGLGWRDRFSIPQATPRQQRYAQTLGLPSAFTPQVVIDGRGSFVGSDRVRILAAMAEPLTSVPIDVRIVAGEVTVTVPEIAGRGEYEVHLAAYVPRASTSVGGGENSGRALNEFNIVRQFRTLGLWSGRREIFHAAVDSLPPDATRVAVLLQEIHQGPIAGSAIAALR